MLAITTGPDKRLKYRFLCLLQLKEEWVARVASDHQHDPGARTDTSDADNLERSVHVLVLIQEHPTVRVEALPVRSEDLPDPIVEFEVLLRRNEVVQGSDRRGIFNDPELAVDDVGQLGERPEPVFSLRLGHTAFQAKTLGLAEVPGPLRVDRINIKMPVPDIEVSHGRKLSHRLSVLAGNSENHLPPLFPAETAVATTYLKARGKSLYIPLPGAREGLVKVVDVKDETSFRRSESPEVGEVRVTTSLNLHARDRTPGQVGHHDCRCSAVEGKSRSEHPAVADRNQLRQTCLGLILKDVNRIRTILWQSEVRQGRTRYPLPRCLARRLAFSQVPACAGDNSEHLLLFPGLTHLLTDP